MFPVNSVTYLPGCTTSTYAAVVPSGEKEAGEETVSLVSNRSATPLPSAACQNGFCGPALVDANPTRLPSGVQAPRRLTPPSNVRRVNASRRKSYNQTWLSASSIVIATREPSGEIFGYRYARGGALASCSEPFRNPHHSSIDAPNAAREIDEQAVGGHVVVGEPVGQVLQDALHDRNGGAGDLQPLRVERHGHEGTRLRVHQVAGRDIVRTRSSLEERPALTSSDGISGDPQANSA